MTRDIRAVIKAKRYKPGWYPYWDHDCWIWTVTFTHTSTTKSFDDWPSAYSWARAIVGYTRESREMFHG